MSYLLNAAIGSFDLLRRVSTDDVVPLRQRMGMVLLDGDLPPHPGTLDGDLPSYPGTIAHVEASFHGGDGDQNASLWRDGERIWGPLYATEFPDDRRDEWPINAVLARLGVVLEPRADRSAYHDLFVEVGFGAEGDHHCWRKCAEAAREFATWDDWHAAEQARIEAAAREAAERARYTRLIGVEVPLDGREVMRILGIPAGQQVGVAVRHLQNLRLERGALSREEAVAALKNWNSTEKTITTRKN
ncbi:hypothetical protein [Actinoplanes couchii]|uniref:Uncharacterized protein n=1 Tax=Actinoplanes couchii TaxID=403638 RepID=A0ABQ3XNS0_9ACTN|nr:hypothetical protein [Actinoplanes couchii]MDR6318038.1 hypothetical protein [Actinoplanes couchii]GID60045.1 hypothetical protein Aco03nite_084490 [Actinoplanes couchii]